MPRKSRIAFANMPHHVYQRGHRRQAVFFSDADRRDYLRTLAECREAMGLKLYAFCLMDNHVHLIIDPGDDSSSLSTAMKTLAGRHARRMNLLHGWRGALWESRFKCSPIETDRYLLTCGRYIDLNPVRAGITRLPEMFEWSSFRARAGLAHCADLDPDPAILALAATPRRCAMIYRDLTRLPIEDPELEFIRGSLRRNQLTGSEGFMLKIEAHTGIAVPNRPPGRPRKPTPETNQAPRGACLWEK